MIFDLFHHKDKDPLPYLDRMEELDKVDIVRLKGHIDQSMIPMIEARIQENRREGEDISKNIIVDYAKVDKIDSAAIAFHILRFKEYCEKGFEIGLINVSEQLKSLLDIHHQGEEFIIYTTEEEAIAALNK